MDNLQFHKHDSDVRLKVTKILVLEASAEEVPTEELATGSSSGPAKPNPFHNLLSWGTVNF
jgi:hypothetical protein